MKDLLELPESFVSTAGDDSVFSSELLNSDGEFVRKKISGATL